MGELMTWSDILAEILRSLKEPTGTGHWTPAELLRRANIAQRKIVRYTGCLEAISITTTSIAGIEKYAKPTDYMRITRVLYNYIRIYGISVSDLDIQSAQGSLSSKWQDTTGTPANYYETLSDIYLYPKPTNTGDIIQIEYIKKPTDMAITTDQPFNSIAYLEDYHELIVSYVVWRCLLEDQNELYAEHKNEFLQGMANLKAAMANKPDQLISSDLVNKRRLSTKKYPIPAIKI